MTHLTQTGTPRVSSVLFREIPCHDRRMTYSDTETTVNMPHLLCPAAALLPLAPWARRRAGRPA